MRVIALLILLAGCGLSLSVDEHGVCGTDAAIDAALVADAAPRPCYAIAQIGDSNQRGDGRVPELTGADVALAQPFAGARQIVRLAQGTGNPPAWTVFPLGPVQPHPWVNIDRFGFELTMARDLAAARPDVDWLFIKYAIGGSTLYDNWNPNTSSPWIFASTHDSLDAELAANGCTLVGYDWELGGADAQQISRGTAYDTRDQLYVDAVRARHPGVLFFVGRLHDSTAYTYASLVQTGQDNLTTKRPGVYEINQAPYTLRSDGFHYDTPSVIALGHDRAAAVLSVVP